MMKILVACLVLFIRKCGLGLVYDRIFLEIRSLTLRWFHCIAVEVDMSNTALLT